MSNVYLSAALTEPSTLVKGSSCDKWKRDKVMNVKILLLSALGRETDKVSYGTIVAVHQPVGVQALPLLVTVSVISCGAALSLSEA